MNENVTNALVAAVSKAQPKPRFLSRFFAGNIIKDTRYVELQGKLKKARVASFVNPTAVADGTEKLSFTREPFVLPTIQDLQSITGDDLENIVMGDTEYVPRTPEEKLGVCVAQTIQDQKDMVAVRQEVMAVEALFDGKITIVGKGENRVIDFGRPAELTVDVGAVDVNKYWGGTASDISGDFDTAIELLAEYGSGVTHVIGRSATIKKITSDATIKGELDNRRTELGSITYMADLLATGAIYHGHYKEVAIFSYACNYTDKDGNAQKAVPANKVVFVAENNENLTAYGDYPDIESLLNDASSAKATKDNKNFTAKIKADGKAATIEAIQTTAPMLADTTCAVSMQVSA